MYATSNKCGCIDGTMRKTIIKIALKLNIEVFEQEGFSEQDLLQADEVLLTNAIQGVNYVSGFKGRRYYHTFAAKLIQQLNLLLEK
jgi:branched-chain amino acid aminotransferase